MLVSSLGLLLIVYGAGVVRVWRSAGQGHGIRPREVFAFACGWSAIAIALSGPIDELSDRWMAMHMVQHELLMVVAAPLLASSAPLIAMLWAAPSGMRRSLLAAIRRPRGISAW